MFGIGFLAFGFWWVGETKYKGRAHKRKLEKPIERTGTIGGMYWRGEKRPALGGPKRGGHQRKRGGAPKLRYFLPIFG